MIKFKNVEYRNFMSVGNHPINIKLDKADTTLVSGNNGSGKSLFLYALTYALYGKLLSGMKLGQAINSVNKKNLVTKVEFETKGEEWQVIRGEKPKKFEIYRNGEQVDQYANSRDQQRFLEVILGMDYKLFSQVVVVNKEQYVPFMEMNAANRRKIVEDILGISIFSYMNESTKAKLTEKKKQYSNLDKNYEVNKKDIEGKQTLIKELRTSLDQENEHNYKEIAQKKQEIEELENQQEQLKNKDTELSEKTKPHSKVKKQLKEFGHLSNQFSNQRDDAIKNGNFFINNDTCPTCYQYINEDLKEQKKQETKESTKEIEATINDLIIELQKTVDEDEYYEKLQQERITLNQDLQQMAFQISSKNSDIKSLEAVKVDYSKNDKIEDYVNQYNELESKINDNNDEMRIINDEIDNLNEMLNLLKDDGIKSLIIKEYNSIINKKINDYLNSMGYYVNLTIDENFKESFHTMNKEGFTYQNLSTGQKTRVDVAIFFALLEVGSIKNNTATNIMFLDELTSNLDKDGCQDIMRLIREKLPSKNIFIVDQRSDLFSDLCTDNIHFKLNNDFTEIVSN